MVRVLKWRFGLPLLLVVVMWLVEAANLVTHNALDAYGIRPRTEVGLWGIVFAPFLHASLAHLLANTLPFLMLGWLIAVRRLRDFLLVALLVMVVGGFAVWLLGRPMSDHIGASGVIFGFLGFLLARGFFERSVQALAVALITFALYGGALWGVLPAGPGISWEGHLFGALSGIAAGRVLAEESSRSEVSAPGDRQLARRFGA